LHRNRDEPRMPVGMRQLSSVIMKVWDHASVISLKKNGGIENMKTMKIGVVLLALLLAGLAMVPIVSAVNNDERNDLWNDSQVQKYNSLIGKEITAGELYEIVDPEFLKSLPEDLRASYYQTKVQWPTAPGKDTETTITFKPESITNRAGQVVLNFGTFASPIGRTISYFSQSVSSPPTTFIQMYDKSTLIKYENGHYYYVDHRAGTGYLCTLHYVSGLKSVQPGTYVVLGEHSGISLPGILDPPAYGPVYSQSSYVTIS